MNFVYPVAFFASYLGAAWGWFRLRRCRCARDFWFGLVALFVGFCLSVGFGLLTVVRFF